MLSPAQAAAAIAEHATPLAADSLPLTHLVGTVLREAIVASRDQPPFDRVTMDGIAFASSAGQRTFRIAGTQAAGAPRMVLASTDACFEVMTGAAVPTGCDCVVPVERISIADGAATVHDDVPLAAGMNIHPRGFDCRAGEPLLEPGTRLGPPEVAVIAASGLSHAQASRSPRIAVISTGDELVEPGEPVREWQIYRSNAYGVLASLQRRGYTHVALDHLPDDLDILRERLARHLETHDVLILSGGVSMGKFDFIPQVLTELGIAAVFHKIAQRPGKPMWFGVGRTPATEGRTIYALPGNPVSTLVCLGRYVLPGLAAAMGASQNAPEHIALAEPVDVKVALTLFMPVQCLSAAAGQVLARPRPTKGSGDFTSLIGTDGFVELPPGPTVVPAGMIVPFYRW
ncbi:molybdopterin molybdotransferase MoeA [Povalibacter sp.]|uniref:molybdopterin molybdotransferase MoeA n=1 Tax=Povalibacter sp. TaxID=1962978 RepID=UPI002F3F720C